jgi:hypothetical protein
MIASRQKPNLQMMLSSEIGQWPGPAYFVNPLATSTVKKAEGKGELTSQLERGRYSCHD